MISKDRSLRQVIERGVDAGLISRDNAHRLIERLHTRVTDSGETDFVVDMQNGRSFEFAIQAMEDRGMVVLVEDITERKLAEAKINHLARFDALTGLPNRVTLRDRMEQLLEDWRPDNMCAIHFIDLDQKSSRLMIP